MRPHTIGSKVESSWASSSILVLCASVSSFAGCSNEGASSGSESHGSTTERDSGGTRAQDAGADRRDAADIDTTDMDAADIDASQQDQPDAEFDAASEPDASSNDADTNDAAAGDGSSSSPNDCSALGQVCCTDSVPTCRAHLQCLNQSTCSCVQSLPARYVLRVDGVVLQMDGVTPVLDSATAKPLYGTTAVSDGRHHGCAVASTKEVYCWPTDAQGNAAGQLGNGTRDAGGATYRGTPVLQRANQTLKNVSSLAVPTFAYYTGMDAECAVLASGELHCWGDLTWLINVGTTLSSPYSQPITLDGLNALNRVTQAAIGDGYSACALRSTSGGANEVWCWGHNYSYNLGQGDQVNRQYPVKVLGLTNPTKVTIAANADGGTGVRTVCAIDGGQVRCWGANVRGQAGVNLADQVVTTPTLVKLSSGVVLDRVVDLQASGNESGYSGDGPNFCALRDDHTIWCWGDSFQRYAANYGATNVFALGFSGLKPRYVTDDGVYHLGSQATQAVACGDLE